MKQETLQLIQKINNELQLITDSDLHYNDKRFVERVRTVNDFKWFNVRFDSNDFFEFEFRNHLMTMFVLKLNEYITKHRSEVLESKIFEDIINLTRTVDCCTEDYFEYKLQNIVKLHYYDKEELMYMSKH